MVILLLMEGNKGVGGDAKSKVETFSEKNKYSEELASGSTQVNKCKNGKLET